MSFTPVIGYQLAIYDLLKAEVFVLIRAMILAALYPRSTKRREGLENPSPTPKISRDPRDFPRAKPEGNLEGRGKSVRFSEAVDFAPQDPRDFSYLLKVLQSTYVISYDKKRRDEDVGWDDSTAVGRGRCWKSS